MAGMYEKLGDLLNETLETGHVKFIHIEKNIDESSSFGNETASSMKAEPSAGEKDGYKKTESFAENFRKAEAEAEKIYFKTSRGFSESAGKRIIYKRITPELEKAYRLLGIDSGAGRDDVKKAYKEKLLYYHPDRYAGKEVMEKIANDKTRELVNAYNLIMENFA